ncbi:hypothetical protein BGZ96_012645 [Linnemannia gamsii]|uniref:Uncharacterized protein n=1 Tax=Linnemannia gamsii TaxID=64522 RepID=A0ABQ7JQP5_9FUNG|nr:hypothetical protein BGZ96_012645 [Linnemannia gamsii]
MSESTSTDSFTTTTTSSSSTASETITSSIISSIASSLTATATATSSYVLPTPTPTSSPDTSEDGFYTGYPDPYRNPKLLCDWTRTASDCRDADFTKYMLIASSAAHLFVALFGLWLLAYRNRGFNRKIVTELFTYVGTGLRPKPMDCIIFFTSIACAVKVAANLPLVFGVLVGHMWLRVAIEQLYWVFVAFAFSAYFVGLLYAMPVTTREGIFALYQPEVAYGATPLPPIHVLTPTTIQKNFILAIGLIYPTIFGAGLGIASGVLHDKGYEDASKVLLYLQYSNWVLILWAMAIMFFYYGLKYTFILRANIIIAEAALKAPRAAFGIGNLKSRSPARFLFIQLQITGFGGCAVTVLAGSLCMIWVIFRDRILEMQGDRWPHIMGVFWTCAIALAFFVCFALIAAQSVRSRRRNLSEPSTTTLSHSGGPSIAQKSSSNRNSKQGAQQAGVHGSDPEARLTQQYSYDDQSTVDSEKHSMEHLDRYIGNHDDLERAAAAASVAAMVHLSEGMDREDNEVTTPRSGRPASTSRPLNIQINSGNASTNVNGHSNIRESVFGGRTAREETAGPTSPSHGFTLPSFPLVAMRSGSRNSIQPRPSTSSTNHTSSGTHTASTTSSRFSFGSNKRASLVSAQGQQQQQQQQLQQQQPTPLSPTSPISPTGYNSNMHLSLQQQTQQQLQQLQMQQDQSGQGRTTMQRIQVKAGGAFQPIPEQNSPAESSYSGDLLYTDALRLQQQQQQQQQSSPQSTTSPRISAQRGKSSAKAQPSPNLGPLPNSSNNGARYEYQGSNRPISPPPRVSTSSARSYGNNNINNSQFQDPDMQLQQQHPFHQVAYTGLSPPPRSAPMILPLGPSSPSGPTPTSPIRRNGPGLPSVGSSPVITNSQPSSPPLAPVSPPFAATRPQEYSPSLRGRVLETATPVAPTSPSVFAVGYNTDDQQAPKVGGAVRRSTHSTKSSKDTGAAAAPALAAPPMSPSMLASRGPGGGYQTQRPAESSTTSTSGPISVPPPTPLPAPVAQPKSLRQQNSKFQQAPTTSPAPVPMPVPLSGGGGAYHHHGYGHYNHGDEYDEDDRDLDGRSIDSAGDDSWPMPPSFK